VCTPFIAYRNSQLAKKKEQKRRDRDSFILASIVRESKKQEKEVGIID
jgi:hypothetical protein